MITATKFSVHKTNKSRLAETNFDALEFGKTVSDHMLSADYRKGAWTTPQLIPYGPIVLSPTALSLHYGQTVFEGMKAFRTNDGSISIFRIEKHYQRLSKSLERMSMPALPFELFSEGLQQLIHLDAAWVPKKEGHSLYLRPFVFASNEERFGVHESDDYRFLIITGPVGPYYSKTLKLKVEDHFIRAAHGGTGFAKCGGNYGGAFYPTKLARQQGFDQVIWTDGTKDLNIEESGMMNILFVINNILVTPPLSDTILDGITRDSYLTLAADLGYKIEERKIGVKELTQAFENKTIQEAFGSGTAAVAAPIGSISMMGKEYLLPPVPQNGFMIRAKHMLEAIRTGNAPDTHRWNTLIKI
jgi:branched-chain amino acid aminotransferase